MSSEADSLPTYADEHLAACSTDELWRLLVSNEDRVPRNLIDECARRGDEIVERAASVLDKDYYWSGDHTEGEWWLRLHAVLIVGLVPGERAGELLAAYMRRMDEAEDENLQEWLSGGWPALFRNKPDTVLPPIRAFAEDRARGWYARLDAIDILIASARAAGGVRLEETLAWAAGIAFDEAEDFDVRSLTGSKLLDFARPEYRSGLEALADMQPDDWHMFSREEIGHAYEVGEAPPVAGRFDDPWRFYAPEAIAERQRRWVEEDAALDDDVEENPWDEPGETYVRPGPKIGRNDLCPCGSGKKYKKCCGREA